MKKIIFSNEMSAFGESGITPISVNDVNQVLKFIVEVITLPGPTRNGMLYPKKWFEEAVNDSRIQDLLNNGAFYGEMAHPIDPSDLKRWVESDMTKVTHKFTKLWFEGNKLMGEVQTFSGNGNLMYHAIKGGEKPAFSIRVVGEPKPKGEYTELENIVLLAIDWVRYPGNPTSRTTMSSLKDMEVIDAPLYLEAAHTRISRAESTEVYRVLGIPEDKELVSLAEGKFAIVDTLEDSDISTIFKNRLETF